MRNTTSKMIKVARFVSAVVSAVTSPGGIVTAQAEQQFMRPDQAAKILADARPWAATKRDGREAKVSFSPDGTGTFEGGPMSLSTKWAIKGEDICITMSIVGVTCHRFVKVSGGLDGYTEGVLDLQLRR